MVHVYIAKLRSSEHSHEYQSIQAHKLLDMALEREYPELPAPFLLEKDGNEKPYLKDYPQIHVNLSHSGCYAACAIGEKPVGVDVEVWKTGRNRNRVVEKFHPLERAFFRETEAEKREACLYSLWVLKESFLKATGKGLRLPLDSFCCLPGEERVRQQVSGEHYYQKLYFPGQYFSELDSQGQEGVGLAVCSLEQEFAKDPIWLAVPESERGAPG